MGKSQAFAKKNMSPMRDEFDKKGLYEKLNSRIRQALAERPREEDVDEDTDWRGKTGEFPILDLLHAKPR